MSAKHEAKSIHTTSGALATALSLALALVNSGCQRHWAGRPERPAYLREVKAYDTADHFQQLESKYEAPGASEEQKREARDKYVRHALRVLDVKYCQFLDDLIYDRKGFDSSADILAIGLDTASVLFEPPATKSILAGAAAVTTGTKVAIDKTYFYDQTLPVLVHQMEADRQTVLTDVMINLDKPTTAYRLDDALRDLGRYYHAGTIDGALVAVQQRAAQQQKEAETRLKEVKANNDALALQLRGSIEMWLRDEKVSQNERNTRLKKLKDFIATTFALPPGMDQMIWLQGATSSQLATMMGSLDIPKKTQKEIDEFHQKMTKDAEEKARDLSAREKAALEEMCKGEAQWQAALTAVKTWFKSRTPEEQGADGDTFYDDGTAKGIDFAQPPFSGFVLSGQNRIDPGKFDAFLDALSRNNKAHQELLARFIAGEKDIVYPKP